MIKKLKKIFVLLLTLILATIIFTGCIQIIMPPNVMTIEKTSTDGYVDTYTITYTDGSTSTFTITNGRDGVNGEDGDDSPEISVEDLFNRYKQEKPTATFEEFLREFLNVETDISASTVNRLLSSTVKVYAEFTLTDQTTQTNYLSVGAGSGVIYRIDDDYTYIITNFHVIHEYNQNTTSKMSRKITCYLYGSELNPLKIGTDEDGYTIYDYGTNAIQCEIVGASIATDIAVLKAPTQSFRNVNENFTKVEFADNYHVGETAIAIGNPGDDGISVTKGIVSVDNERVKLKIDNTIRTYNLLRMDTPLYQGNSGGGLFNVQGKLIGITNAGDSVEQNVNFAVPINTVKNAVENIIYYNNGYINKLVFGVVVTMVDSKYVYDKVSGYGQIIEDIQITEVLANSIAHGLGLQINDYFIKLTINGVVYDIYRDYYVTDLILTLRAGDVVSITYKRNGVSYTTANYVIKAEDIIPSA